MDPVLSIIIVSWNTRDLLRKCLASLAETPAARSTQIIVVDNASSDGTVDMVREEFPWVQGLASDRNLGFSAANNLSLPLARGRYVLFLNPDTEVTNGALEAMIGHLDTHADVGLVGTTLLNSDGSLQLSCHRYYSFWRSLAHNRLTDRIAGSRELSAVNRAASPRDVDWMTGACIMVRKTVLEAVGVFDPDFFVYGEEIDLQYRIRRTGRRVVYVPSAGILHHGGQSARQAAVASSFHDYRGRWLFVRKHYSTLSADAYLAKTAAALAFWTLYWAARSFVRPAGGARQQCQAHWRLLTWHLTTSGLAAAPPSRLTAKELRV